MNRSFGLLCLAMIVVLPACSTAAAPRVDTITLCQDVSEPDMIPINARKRFSGDTPVIHAVARLYDLQAGTVVRGSWVSVDAIDAPDYEIDSVEVVFERSGDGTAHFSLTRPDRGWPPGNYKIVVFADDARIAEKPFAVDGAVAATTPAPSAPATPPPAARPVSAPARPQAGRPVAQASPAAPVPVEASRGGTYRHVTGFSFWYPAGWNLQEHDTFLQLVPPNAGTSPEGPTEVYFVAGESVAGQGIFRADDPRVVQYMDQQVMALSPTLQRTRPPVPAGRGQGFVMDWRGRNQHGKPLSARAYISIARDHAVSLIALCLDDLLQRREADLVKMFSSFAMEEGQKDPQLVGRWKLVTSSSLTNWSPWETHYTRASAVAEDSATLIFHPDGTWERNDTSYTLVGAGGIWLEDNSESSSRGSWRAGGGELYMVWENDTWEDYRYELRQTGQGLRLSLTTDKQGQLWERAD